MVNKLSVLLLVFLVLASANVMAGTPALYSEDIQTCSGDGEVFLYQGEDPFQPILTEFTTTRNQLLIFARGDAILTAKINDVLTPLVLEKEVFDPFYVKVHSLATTPGDEITIDGSYSRNARGIQGFITQDAENPVFDLDTFEVVYDDFQENEMYLTTGTYSYIIFDKYTLRRSGSLDLRDVEVEIVGPYGKIVDELYEVPMPIGTQGVVLDNYFVNESGNYTFSIDTQDSVYWPLINCPEPTEPFCGDGNLDEGEQCDDGNNINGDGCSAECTDEDTRIVVTKIICSDEIDLPNWGFGGPNIDENTASDFLDEHPDCYLEPDWYFQWRYHEEGSNPGDNVGEAGPPWQTFGPTDSDGEVTLIVDDLQDTSRLWFREILQEGYIEFTYNKNNRTNIDNVSAEIYCHDDVLNYDNHDYVRNPEYNEIYYCVAWNVLESYCGDGKVDEGEQCDDGNLIDGDGCSAQCTFEFCGDGVVHPPEMCELPGTDNNAYCFQNATECLGNKTGTRDNYGYCDFSCGCQEDPFEYVCIKDSCGATCQADIDCDDGNIHTIDTCSLDSCGCEHEYVPFCGDGITDFGEECDLGEDNGLVCVPEYMGTCTYCDSNCSNVTIPGPFCGDGVLQIEYEQCDDGNNIDGDGCDAFCMFEHDICEVNITYNGSYHVDNETDWIDTNSSVDFFNDTTNVTCEPYDEIKYNNIWLITSVTEAFCESDTFCKNWTPTNFSNETWETYNGSFSGGEESCHILEYVTQTHDGQQSEVKWDCIFVDKTPPVTKKNYGEPHFVDEETWQEWIGLYTPIWLTAYDPEPHPSGVDKTHYRVTRVDDSYCYNPHELCLNATGNGTWHEWNGTNFTVGEESCHLIEYYSIDNVDKIEEVNKMCTFVDGTPPEPIKVVGEPYEIIEVEDYTWNFYPEVNGRCWNGEEDSIDCWEVTLMTPISMTCEDGLPHPVGNERVCFNVGLDGDDATEDYCEYYEGKYDENGDGFCCLDSVIEEFYFNELSEHNLKFYCEDALGNIGPIDDEKFKVGETAFSIWLNKKWNLISTPVKLHDDSMDDVFENISNVTISVTTYDAFEDKWYIYTPDGDPTNDDLHTMLPGWGYWVLMDEDAELLLSGNLLEPAIPPPYKPIKGDAWNLIGYYGAEGFEVYHGPAGAGGNADCELNTFRDSIWDLGFTSLFTYWEPDNPNVWHPLDRFDNMDPGAGYWVFSTQDGVYAPETGCVGFVPAP